MPGKRHKRSNVFQKPSADDGGTDSYFDDGHDGGDSNSMEDAHELAGDSNDKSSVMEVDQPRSVSIPFDSQPNVSVSSDGETGASSNTGRKRPRGSRELQSLLRGNEHSVLADGTVRERGSAPEALFFIKNPKYGEREEVSTHLGGSRMKVTLGIGALDETRNEGEAATNDRPGIMGILHEDQNESWKAGHLLNARLGGKGEARNLTPLTASANSDHETWETRLRDSLQILKQTLERSKRTDLQDTVGFRYSIRVSEELKEFEIRRNGKLEKKRLRNGLKGSIKLVNLDKSKISDAALRALFRQQPPNPDSPFHDPLIRERGLENIFNMEKQRFAAPNRTREERARLDAAARAAGRLAN